MNTILVTIDKSAVIMMRGYMNKYLTMAADVSERSTYSVFKKAAEKLSEANGIFLTLKEFALLTEQEIDDAENDIERIRDKVKMIWQENAARSYARQSILAKR